MDRHVAVRCEQVLRVLEISTLQPLRYAIFWVTI